MKTFVATPPTVVDVLPPCGTPGPNPSRQYTVVPLATGLPLLSSTSALTTYCATSALTFVATTGSVIVIVFITPLAFTTTLPLVPLTEGLVLVAVNVTVAATPVYVVPFVFKSATPAAKSPARFSTLLAIDPPFDAVIVTLFALASNPATVFPYWSCATTCATPVNAAPLVCGVGTETANLAKEAGVMVTS